MVNAWSEANRLVLGQVKVDISRDEITAIPPVGYVVVEKGVS